MNFKRREFTRLLCKGLSLKMIIPIPLLQDAISTKTQEYKLKEDESAEYKAELCSMEKEMESCAIGYRDNINKLHNDLNEEKRVNQQVLNE